MNNIKYWIFEKSKGIFINKKASRGIFSHGKEKLPGEFYILIHNKFLKSLHN